MVLLIDNFDSFTFNLEQYFRIAGAEVVTRRNDEVDIVAVESMGPRLIVLSPGPGGPSRAGVCKALVRRFQGVIPIFGVCLGMQVIAEAYGASIVRAAEPVHGKARPIAHDGMGVFCGLPDQLVVTRYHSLVVDPRSVPSCIEISATSSIGEVMALRHREYAIEGVQFHPEALLTEKGMDLVENALRLRLGSGDGE